MVAYIDIDKLYWELKQLYEEERNITKAKKIMIDNFKDILKQNQKDVINEVKKNEEDD